MIVIAGDSYATIDGTTSIMHCPKYSWAGNMIKYHGGHGIAESGSNNLDILDILQPYKNLQCPFIINFSRLARGSRRFNLSQTTYASAVIQKINLEAAHKTIDLFRDRALFWTPFPGYEDIPDIQSIFQLEDDELWFDRDNTGKLIGLKGHTLDEEDILGNHFTRKGNDYLFEHFSKWVEAHPLYKRSNK